jgi:hypothetical protein
MDVTRSSYKVSYFCSILTKIGTRRQIFVKIQNTKYHENLSGGSRSVSYGLMDMKKLRVAFCNYFSNASKII